MVDAFFCSEAIIFCIFTPAISLVISSIASIDKRNVDRRKVGAKMMIDLYILSTGYNRTFEIITDDS